MTSVKPSQFLHSQKGSINASRVGRGRRWTSPLVPTLPFQARSFILRARRVTSGPPEPRCPPFANRARSGASLVRRVVCPPTSDVEPDDYVCVDPPRRASIPAALGAHGTVSLKISGRDKSDTHPKVCVTISDDEERSSSAFGAALGPARPPAHPNRTSGDPPLSGRVDRESLSSPPPESFVAAPCSLDTPSPGLSSKDTVTCPCCPAKFLGIDAKSRLRSHVELHFRSSATTAPRTPRTLLHAAVCAHEPQGSGRYSDDYSYRLPSRADRASSLSFVSVHRQHDVRPLHEDFGQQLELFARSCRSLVGIFPAVEILMRGLKVFPSLPSNIMRRILRSFYDEDVTDRALFEKNLLPVYHPGTTSSTSAVPTEASHVPTLGSVLMPDPPDTHEWGDMINLWHVDDFRSLP